LHRTATWGSSWTTDAPGRSEGTGSQSSLPRGTQRRRSRHSGGCAPWGGGAADPDRPALDGEPHAARRDPREPVPQEPVETGPGLPREDVERLECQHLTVYTVSKERGGPPCTKRSLFRWTAPTSRRGRSCMRRRSPGTRSEILLMQAVNLPMPVVPEAVLVPDAKWLDEAKKEAARYLEGSPPGCATRGSASARCWTNGLRRRDPSRGHPGGGRPDRDEHARTRRVSPAS